MCCAHFVAVATVVCEADDPETCSARTKGKGEEVSFRSEAMIFQFKTIKGDTCAYLATEVYSINSDNGEAYIYLKTREGDHLARSPFVSHEPIDDLIKRWAAALGLEKLKARVEELELRSQEKNPPGKIRAVDYDAALNNPK